MIDDANPDRDGPNEPVSGTGRPLGPVPIAVIAGGLLTGAVIMFVGLPAGWRVFGTPAPVLTVVLALFAALSGVSVAGAHVRRASWRIVDIVIASVLGVVGGFYFWVLGVNWEVLSKTLTVTAPPSAGLLCGLWVVPAVLGALVIRKPGAAVYVELVAAVLEALMGDQWGFATVYFGLIQGLGAEFVLALLFYRSFSLVPALLSGAGAGLAVGVLETAAYYPEFPGTLQAGYIGFAVLSGVVLAGAGAWSLTRVLAETGALAPLASGRSAERV
ncbi:MAG: energy-coupling factor transport system permease protein [Actinomycetota bacterium]|nr:energy-coupling factor transport system permease protein [Actinomycetota bacterium]